MKLNKICERYLHDEFLHQLEEFVSDSNDILDAYSVPDTRPRWRRILDRMKFVIYWWTVGKFKAWLHRDCGEW